MTEMFTVEYGWHDFQLCRIYSDNRGKLYRAYSDNRGKVCTCKLQNIQLLFIAYFKKICSLSPSVRICIGGLKSCPRYDIFVNLLEPEFYI